MQRDVILKQLRGIKPHFPDMNIRKLALFGSVARDEAQEGSDVDLLIEFVKPGGLVALAGKKREFEKILGYPVDVYPMQAVLNNKNTSAAKDIVDV